jgi:RNA methyltransferase, TrmH family
MIASRHNKTLKDMRRLRRSKGEHAGDRVLLEGPHLVGEALAAGLALESVVATPAFLAGAEGRALARSLDAPPLAVEPHLLDELADADSPRGIVAVARLPRSGTAGLPLAPNGVYLYAEGVQDPGNLGAIARAAEAAGATGLALSPGTVHPNHPRALRGSAGSLLRLPVAAEVNADALAAHLAPLAPRWAALVPRGGLDLYRAPLEPLDDGALVLLLGAEGPGLSPALAARADLALSIPMAAGVESLNAAVAAAVALFEIRRRRS